MHQRSHARDFRARAEPAHEPAAAPYQARKAAAGSAERSHPHASLKREEPVWQASHAADTPRFPYPKNEEGGEFSPFGTRIEFPRNGGHARRFMVAATLMVAVLVAGAAGAIWLQPDAVPQGMALLKRTASIFGIETPGGDAGGRPRKFGTSPGELPYDGQVGTEDPPKKTNQLPAADTLPAANSPQAASRPQEESSGASGEENGNAAEEKNAPADASAAEQSEAQLAAKSVEPVSPETAESTKAAEAEAAKIEPAPAAKPPPKKDNISHAIRKREISRLRKQAAEELYAE